jgi:hypothetical protein
MDQRLAQFEKSCIIQQTDSSKEDFMAEVLVSEYSMESK